jgi:hypothetical protein
VGRRFLPFGHPALRSLSEATNYDQPQVRILLGVLFYGGGLQLLLYREARRDSGQYCQAAGTIAPEVARAIQLPPSPGTGHST